MGNEIELISDGDGLALFGDPTAIDRFLSSAGVPSKDLVLQQRVSTALSTGSSAAQAGSEITANAGRWVKLTEDSAKAMKVSQLMKGSSSEVTRAVLTDKGKITKLLEFARPGSVGSMLTNPAMLAGAAGIMAQLAMQQTMEEITQYLAIIDEKVDDVLRAQKDAVLAPMIGVGFVIDDAMTVREHTGRVSDVTWSKVQGADQIIATTQAYALRQLDALAEKMEKKSKAADLARLAQDAETTVEDWLAVIARCFQLQEGLGILELDRVLDSSPDDLNRHRTGLLSARRKRRHQISQSTAALIERMDAASGIANTQVLLHPLKSRAVVRSGNEVAANVTVFNEHLGIDSSRLPLEAKRWATAASEAKSKAVETGANGVDAVKRFGTKTFNGAKSASEKMSNEIAERLPGRRANETPPDDND